MFLHKSTILNVWQDSKCDSTQCLTIAQRRSDGKHSTTGVEQGNLRLPLPPNSFDLHQTQKQKDEILDCSCLLIYISSFHGMFSDITQNVWRHSAECLTALPQMSGDIARNVWWHCPKYLVIFLEMFEDIPWNINSPHSPCSPHSVPSSCISGFMHSRELLIMISEDHSYKTEKEVVQK